MILGTECSVSTLASSVTLQRKSWKIYTSTSSTCEMTIGKCSIGDPGTSPSRSCSRKPWRAILFTPFFRTHNILVFHGGDVFTHAKTGGMLSKALKSPAISRDLFQKLSRGVEKKRYIAFFNCLFFLKTQTSSYVNKKVIGLLQLFFRSHNKLK